MNGTDQFHIGIVVDDLESALDELGNLLGYDWCPVFAIETPVVLPEREVMVDLRFAYSKTEPRVGDPGQTRHALGPGHRFGHPSLGVLVRRRNR